MKNLPLIVASILLACIPASAQPTTQPRMASREHRDELIKKARERMARDRDRYNPAQLAECENLYQVANKNWRSEEAKTALKVMMEKYPDVNRTGCASLYLAQFARGAEQEELLRRTIEKYSDCCYGNGVQVGAFARFLLARHHLSRGDRAGAEKLFEEINRDYPGAITHRGVLISELIDRIRVESAATQPAAPAER